MNILDIISKKQKKQKLTKVEIEYFIQAYTRENITDYQAAALIMAIYINGMDDEEIADLTLSMAKSGDILDLSKIGRVIVDKHSTGGVGDKVSLILLPVVASLGVPVAKMSGRGLGFTGGTVDKLESIPGYKTNISEREFVQNVKDIGISMIGQTLNLAPADKKIYALRDAISCTDSIPLIASSIMSKKIASGADKIVLDVTYGSGAFMKTRKEAEQLANKMEKIGELVNKETVCILTSMEQPLGKAVGNNLEVIEAINSLKGKIEEDVLEVVKLLGSYMLKLGDINENLEENEKMVEDAIKSGKGLKKFEELVEKQGGNCCHIEDIEKFQKAKYIIPVVSAKEGVIKQIDALKVAKIAYDLGAGRIKKEDNIDYTAGIVLEKKVGDKVKVGDLLGSIHSNKECISQVEELKNCYQID